MRQPFVFALNLSLVVSGWWGAFSAHARMAGDDGKGAWVMIDLRNNYAKRGLNEGKMVEQMAKKGQNEFLRFNSFESFQAALAKRPGLRIDTLVLSGHATGSCFVSENDSRDTTPAKFLELTSRYAPVFSETNAIYYMGCNTGIWENLKGWLQPFHRQVLFTAANGIGPSNEDGSATLIARLEQERQQLPAHPSDADLVRAQRDLLGKNAAFAAVVFGIADKDTVSRSIDINREHSSDDSAPAALEAPRYIRYAKGGSVKTVRANIYAPDKCGQPLGELEKLLKGPRKSGESTGSFENIFDYLDQFTQHAGKEILDLPTTPFSELRRAYGLMQQLQHCDSILTSSARWHKVFRFNRNNADEDSTQPAKLKDHLIVLIHGNNVMHNYLVCAKPWIQALAARIEKCTKGDNKLIATQIRTALSSSSDAAARRALFTAYRNGENLQENNQLSDEAAHLMDTWDFVFNPSYNLVPKTWFDPIASIQSPVCASFRELNNQASRISRIACTDQVTYPDFEPWSGDKIGTLQVERDLQPAMGDDGHGI